MNRLKTLITEAHRRSLWQVLLIYVGAGWVVFEIVQTAARGAGGSRAQESLLSR